VRLVTLQLPEGLVWSGPLLFILPTAAPRRAPRRRGRANTDDWANNPSGRLAGKRSFSGRARLCPNNGFLFTPALDTELLHTARHTGHDPIPAHCSAPAHCPAPGHCLGPAHRDRGPAGLHLRHPEPPDSRSPQWSGRPGTHSVHWPALEWGYRDGQYPGSEASMTPYYIRLQCIHAARLLVDCWSVDDWSSGVMIPEILLPPVPLTPQYTCDGP
jgi:hypothetical protein